MLIRLMVVGGGLGVLAGCGRVVHQTVAAVPVASVDSCLTEALHSRGDSVVVYRSEKLVRLLVPGGAWVNSETRPTNLGSTYRATTTYPDSIVRMDEFNPDQRSDSIRALGQSSGFWLTRDRTGNTLIETRSSQLWLYRDIAERCAVSQASTEVGIGLDESRHRRVTFQK